MLYLCDGRRPAFGHRSQQTPPGWPIFASAVLAMLPLQRQLQQPVAIAPAALGDRPFVSLFIDYLLALINF